MLSRFLVLFVIMLVILLIILVIFLLIVFGCFLSIFFIMVNVRFLLNEIESEFFVCGLIIFIKLEILLWVILFFFKLGLFGFNFV